MKIGLGLICSANKHYNYIMQRFHMQVHPGPHVLVEPLLLHYGESKDPGKMTHTGMACIERGLGAKPVRCKGTRCMLRSSKSSHAQQQR